MSLHSLVMKLNPIQYFLIFVLNYSNVSLRHICLVPVIEIPALTTWYSVSPSRFLCSLPARCSIYMSYVDVTSSQRSNSPSGSLNHSSHFNELGSVLAKNLCPYKKCLKCLLKVTKARSPFLTHALLFDLQKSLLAYTTTLSRPSCSCEIIAPRAHWLASVSNMNGIVKSGCVRMGTDVNLSLRSLNESLSVHLNKQMPP